MAWAEHLRKHIAEREEERLHLRCEIIEVTSDPLLSEIEKKKALANLAKDSDRLDKLILALIAAQDGEPE